jgi:hypothetical protein
MRFVAEKHARLNNKDLARVLYEYYCTRLPFSDGKISANLPGNNYPHSKIVPCKQIIYLKDELA